MTVYPWQDCRVLVLGIKHVIFGTFVKVLPEFWASMDIQPRIPLTCARKAGPEVQN